MKRIKNIGWNILALSLMPWALLGVWIFAVAIVRGAKMTRDKIAKLMTLEKMFRMLKDDLRMVQTAMQYILTEEEIIKLRKEAEEYKHPQKYHTAVYDCEGHEMGEASYDLDEMGNIIDSSFKFGAD